MNRLVKVYKAMGDETRFNILMLLASRNICAKGISKHLDITEAAVSQHIKILKEAELITGYKKGYHIMYELNKDILTEAQELIQLLIIQDISQIQSNYSSADVKVCKLDCKWVKGCCNKEKGE